MGQLDGPRGEPDTVTQLETALERLLDEYTKLLSFVETLPVFGRVPVRVQPPGRYRWWDAGSWMYRPWRPVCRPLVRLYVQAHAGTQLRWLRRHLRPGRVQVSPGEQARRLRQVRGQVHIELAELFSWWQLGRIVVALPAVTGLVTLLYGWLLTVGPVRPDGAHVGAAVTELALLLFLLLVYAANPSIVVGYRPARALLSDGCGDGAPFNGIELIEHRWAIHELTLRWVGFPRFEVSQCEAQLHGTLGRGRPRRLPLDLLVDFWLLIGAYSVAVATYFLVIGSWPSLPGALEQAPTGAVRAILAGMLAFAVLFAVVRAVSNVMLYRRRIARGQL